MLKQLTLPAMTCMSLLCCTANAIHCESRTQGPTRNNWAITTCMVRSYIQTIRLTFLARENSIHPYFLGNGLILLIVIKCCSDSYINGYRHFSIPEKSCLQIKLPNLHSSWFATDGWLFTHDVSCTLIRINFCTCVC